MTSDEIRDACKQMMVSCDMKQADYTPVSARGVLYELGYSSAQADEVIQFLFTAGFNHCIDPMFPVKTRDGVEEPTPQFACVWGPDQLKSRIRWCV